MKIKSVTFVSRAVAKKTHPKSNSALISIFTPGDTPPYLHWRSEWRFISSFMFFDSEAYEDQKYYPGISMTEAETMFLWIKNVVEEKEVEHIVVHCDAGVSRSAGVALFIAERYGLNFPKGYSHFNKMVYRSLKEVEFNFSQLGENFEK